MLIHHLFFSQASYNVAVRVQRIIMEENSVGKILIEFIVK